MEQELTLANTWFKQHRRRLATWTSPDGITKNQIDYIGIQRKWRTSISNCKTYPGADCDTDHNLLVATLKIRIGRQKKEEIIKRLNVEELQGYKGLAYEMEVTNRFKALNMVAEERSPNEVWKETKEVLLTAAEEIVGYKKRDKEKHWITEETHKLIIKKREAKQRDREEYKERKAEKQRLLRRDKQNQMEEMCEKVEAENKRGNSRYLYRAVKSITNKFQPKIQSVQAENGEYITDKEGIAERWKQYCEELYNDKESSEQITGYEREPPPLRAEVARAIRQVASGKTAGPDGVPAELFKHGGEKILEKMHYICTALWEDGEWPDDCIESIFVPTPKKGDARQCSNHGTVALVAHASKIILRIILERIRTQTESEVAEEQAGFRKARGTRDQITNL
jgi:hypothetical protein